jgi:catechol 2,3-dioxygenase-like lactoylglutathione lyase family enzyme
VLANAPCQAVLSGTDLNKARKFYGKTLGRPIENEIEGEGIMVGAGARSKLYLYSRADPPKATNAIASFIVADVRETLDALKEAGLVFQEYEFAGVQTSKSVANMGPGSKSAWFLDPFGNILSISNM